MARNQLMIDPETGEPVTQKAGMGAGGVMNAAMMAAIVGPQALALKKWAGTKLEKSGVLAITKATALYLKQGVSIADVPKHLKEDGLWGAVSEADAQMGMAAGEAKYTELTEAAAATPGVDPDAAPTAKSKAAIKAGGTADAKVQQTIKETDELGEEEVRHQQELEGGKDPNIEAEQTAKEWQAENKRRIATGRKRIKRASFVDMRRKSEKGMTNPRVLEYEKGTTLPNEASRVGPGGASNYTPLQGNWMRGLDEAGTPLAGEARLEWQEWVAGGGQAPGAPSVPGAAQGAATRNAAMGAGSNRSGVDPLMGGGRAGAAMGHPTGQDAMSGGALAEGETAAPVISSRPASSIVGGIKGSAASAARLAGRQAAAPAHLGSLFAKGGLSRGYDTFGKAATAAALPTALAMMATKLGGQYLDEESTNRQQEAQYAMAAATRAGQPTAEDMVTSNLLNMAQTENQALLSSQLPGMGPVMQMQQQRRQQEQMQQLRQLQIQAKQQQLTAHETLL